MTPELPLSADELRRRAELGVRPRASMVRGPHSAVDAERLLHELQVYQLELELQNEELRKARDALENVATRYTNLYDFAPVGYITLDCNRQITQANLAAGRFFGMVPTNLIGLTFATFVSEADLLSLEKFLQLTFAGGPARRCEVELADKSQPKRAIQIEAVCFDDGQELCLAMTDISELKLAEDSMQKREQDLFESQRSVSSLRQRLALAVKGAGFGVWEFDLTTNRLIWDEQMHRVYGFPSGGFDGSPEAWQSCIHPEDREIVNARFGELLAGTTVPLFLFRINRHNDGALRFIEANGYCQTDDGGQPHQLVGMNRDVTERVAADETLRRSNQLLEASQSTAKVGGWELDIATNHLFWTAETYRLHDTSPTEFNPTVDAGVGCYLPESRRIISAAVQAAMEHGKGYDLVLEVLTTKGRKIDVRTTCAVTLKEGRPAKLTGIFQDITAQKQAEAALRDSEYRFKLVSLATNDVISDRDLCNDSFWWSERFQTEFGYTPQDIAPGSVSWRNRVHPEDLMRVESSLLQFYEGTGVVWSEEYRFRRGDGKYIAVVDRGIVIRDDTGKAMRLVCAMQDISERKAAEASIQTSLQEKETLLREVHHRVKNNLQVISSLLSLEIQRTHHHSTQIAFLDMTHRIRAMALLHETLYRRDNFVSVDLAEYLRDLASQFFRAQVSRARHITLGLDLESNEVDIDQTVPCGLLLNELLSNCLKHAFPDEREGNVNISLSRIDDGAMLNFRVSDNGVGLPSDFEARCGQSLGMQLVVDLAKQLGGEFHVLPVDGNGCVFEVVFSSRSSTTKSKRH